MAVSASLVDDRRSRIYDGLLRRNRLVSILRVGVPALGAVLLLVLLVQIAIDNLSEQFGFANIHIDREKLVLDTPQLTSTAPDGTLYAATATSAKVSIGKTDMADLTDAMLSMTPPGDNAVRYTAMARAAALQLTDQKVLVPGELQISGTDGMAGTLQGVAVDVLNSQMSGNGPVHIRFGNGSELDAQSMTYDGNAEIFHFSRVVVVLNNLPEAKK